MKPRTSRPPFPCSCRRCSATPIGRDVLPPMRFRSRIEEAPANVRQRLPARRRRVRRGRCRPAEARSEHGRSTCGGAVATRVITIIRHPPCLGLRPEVSPSPLSARSSRSRRDRRGRSAARETATRRATAAARRLSLEDALRIAAGAERGASRSRAPASRARTGQRYQARSQYLPQLNGGRGLRADARSQFQGVSFGGAADTSPAPTTAVPVCANDSGERDAGGEPGGARAGQHLQAAAGGFDFSSVGFGAHEPVDVRAELLAERLHGGRIPAQNQAANASAELGEDRGRGAARAARARRHAGVLRRRARRPARVDRGIGARADGGDAAPDARRAPGRQSGGVRPAARTGDARQSGAGRHSRRGNARQVAYYRLKQLLNLPMDEPLELATPLDDSTATTSTVIAAVNAGQLARVARVALAALDADTNVAIARQCASSSRACARSKRCVKAARGERLPSIADHVGLSAAVLPDATSFRSGTTRARTGRSARRLSCRCSRAAGFAATR